MTKFLHVKSSFSVGIETIQLDRGAWDVNSDGHYFLNSAIDRLELNDGLYIALEPDEATGNEENPHYSAVIDALEPVFSCNATSGSFTIDGIFYQFKVTENEEKPDLDTRSQYF